MHLFRRKPINRRTGRDHVLDVKLRSDQVRANRVRWIAIALGCIFATIFSFYIIWSAGQWGLNVLVYENQAFAIQDVDIQTDGVISTEQLKRWSGIKPNENLLSLDLARVKRDLEMVSLIRSAAVERVLPHTLKLRVSEREPVAQVYVPRALPEGGSGISVLHIDDEGYLMALLDPNQRATPSAQTNDVLPFISGINPNQVVPGRRIDSGQVRSALQFISAFEHSPMSNLVDVRTIDISSPEILQITTGEGSEVTFFVRDIDRQMRRWREIHEQVQKAGKAITTLDLSVPNNIPVRWVDATTTSPPSVTPKIRNTQRIRRKNV